jgi:peptide-methionine (R)-S-oxide reductase
MRIHRVLLLWPVLGGGCQRPARVTPTATVEGASTNMGDKVIKTDAEWRKILTPEQFHILREKGTERAFTGAYYASHDRALYVCAACGQELFSSEQKFDSGTGWPSFWAPVSDKDVETETDRSLGMSRTEVRCSRCGGHLGHVFDDGPKPTGLRYCINSAALKAVAPK